MTNKVPYVTEDKATIEYILNNQQCAIQPYLSGNYQVDLLLRNHNWAGGVNKPTTITYSINPHNSRIFRDDFFSNEEKFIELFIENVRNILPSLLPYENKNKVELIPYYIEGNDNRDAFHLYENNFASSYDQKEHLLTIELENTKRLLKANADNDNLQKFQFLTKVNSIYELELHKDKFIGELLDEDTAEKDCNDLYPSEELINSRAGLIISYTFEKISEFANITFKEVSTDANVDFLIPIKHLMTLNKHSQDTLFFIENFHHKNGKTDYVEMAGFVAIEEVPNNMVSGFHGIGHLLIDHPNDSNIANRDLLLPDDHSEKWLNGYYNISNEYRADNGCMSVMAFTNCYYENIKLAHLTYMPIDIQALQHMYSKNHQTRSDDTTYILTANQTFVNSMESSLFPMDIPVDTIHTLYDAGGVNNFDLSNVKQAKIDLSEGAGHFNVIGNNIFLIAYDTHIHNVKVGSGEINIKLHEKVNNIIEIPQMGAHVTIHGFKEGDIILLDGNITLTENLIGCVNPYESDNETQICFI